MSTWMEECAVLALKEDELWEWPDSGPLMITSDIGNKFKPLAANVMSLLIQESQKLGGTILDHFWDQLGKESDQLRRRIKKLQDMAEQPRFTAQEVPSFLFEGLQQNKRAISRPIFEMAQELFIHLAIPLYCPPKMTSSNSTPDSVDDIVVMGTEELLNTVNTETMDARSQEALMRLALKRDGNECLMTKRTFCEWQSFKDVGDGITPRLAWIMPNSVRKTSTLNALAMFTGHEIVEVVNKNLNGIQNVVNMEMNACQRFEEMVWGIECVEVGNKRTYFYRRTEYPVPLRPGPAFNLLKHGDEINFGCGTDGEKLGIGPHPLLCNVQLAAAHAIRTSGLAPLINQVRYEADDSDYCHSYISSSNIVDILTHKLLLCHPG